MSVKKFQKLRGHKNEIMDAAINLFYENSYDKVTFQMIADAVGISQPAIYNHFKNKLDLLVHCCHYRTIVGREYMEGQVNQLDRPGKQLRTYLTETIRKVKKFPKDMYLEVCLYHNAHESSEAKDIINTL